MGNRFLYEYGKCEDEETGKIQTRYKYIDATCEAGGMFGQKNAGLIPCVLNSVYPVLEESKGIPLVTFNKTVPICKRKSSM